MKGELKNKAAESISSIVSDIALRVESIMDYINGSKGIEPDADILETVNADIEELWSELT